MSFPKEIQVILARQLAGCLAMPILIVDTAGTLIFYNEPAEAILNQRFEETGEMPADAWSGRFALADVPAGAYRLRVEIADQVYRRVLASGDSIIELPAGAYEDRWEAESDTIGKTYAARILNNNPGDVMLTGGQRTQESAFSRREV